MLTKCILQTDSESSIKHLTTKLAQRHLGVCLRTTAVGSSASNGGVERYHRSVQGLVRTTKHALETTAPEFKMKAKSDLATWAVRHAAWVQDRFQRRTCNGLRADAL